MAVETSQPTHTESAISKLAIRRRWKSLIGRIDAFLPSAVPAPNYALQRSWTHKLQGRGRLISVRTRYPTCAGMGRRAAAELRR
jgi:hypothetical protein